MRATASLCTPARMYWCVRVFFSVYSCRVSCGVQSSAHTAVVARHRRRLLRLTLSLSHPTHPSMRATFSRAAVGAFILLILSSVAVSLRFLLISPCVRDGTGALPFSCGVASSFCLLLCLFRRFVPPAHTCAPLALLFTFFSVFALGFFLVVLDGPFPTPTPYTHTEPLSLPFLFAPLFAHSTCAAVDDGGGRSWRSTRTWFLSLRCM